MQKNGGLSRIDYDGNEKRKFQWTLWIIGKMIKLIGKVEGGSTYKQDYKLKSIIKKRVKLCNPTRLLPVTGSKLNFLSNESIQGPKN